MLFFTGTNWPSHGSFVLLFMMILSYLTENIIAHEAQLCDKLSEEMIKYGNVNSDC